MRKKTIVIKANPFTYNDESEDLTYESIRAITVEDATNLLQTTKALFDEINLMFYLSFGTLLGAVRDKTLIKGDEDVDVYIENEQLLYDNIPFLYDNGLKLCRMIQGIMYSFKTDGDAYIDIYIKRSFRFALWKPWCWCLMGHAMPKKYFAENTSIDFLGMNFNCVKNPENLLAFWYGDSWRIPVRGHKFIYEIKLAYWWRNSKLWIESTVKFMIGWKYWKSHVK